MTTIVYRDGIMAADTLVTGSDVRRGYVEKIGATPSGNLVGVAGHAGMLDKVIAWLDTGAKRDDFPKLPQDCALYGMMAMQDGRIAVFSKDGVLQFCEGNYHAQGSGNEIALGALAMGATAVQAVEAAAKFDVYTGGRITTVSIPALSSPRKTRSRA